ncbi:MAG: type II secretion system protein [Verrucomicrobiales bacterium]|nr:type II secretion system protein [Verrucomicrobiales bacterium]
MKLHPFSRHRQGFTLIELLVVVAIIALLAVGIISGYTKITKGAKVKASQMVCVQVANAVSQFYSDYEGLPTEVGGEDTEQTSMEGDLIAILLAKGEVAKNPRKLNYLEGMKQAKKGSSGAFEDGLDFESDPTKPTLLDPWGQAYKIKMDSDLNNEIENPEKDATPKIIRGKRCIVWAPGPDKNYDTWNDNVKSW